MAESYVLDHPVLGRLRGVKRPTVIQFLGVRYASIRVRFAASELCTGPKSGLTDATDYGPLAASSPSALKQEFDLIQHSLPRPDMTHSETDCLNLNITIPKLSQETSGLPVFVFLHGGGFHVGGNSWPQYDCARIVELSAQEKSPIIGININYRLGVSGFLTSKDMVECGYKENNGLQDQRNAMRWIRSYIEGFGGDPARITVIGQSAGAVSIMYHLQQQEGLFIRAVVMGGSDLLVKPLQRSTIESTYQTIVARLGLNTLKSAQERVEALSNIPFDDLSTVLTPDCVVGPVVGGELDLQIPSFDKISSATWKLPGAMWCSQLMIGDCQMDASILSLMIGHKKESIRHKFTVSVESALADLPGASTLLLDSYHINTAESDEASWFAVLNFANDILFYAPTISYAMGSIPANVYAFNEKNPWTGPWQGHAPHIFDVACLFLNFNEHMPAEQQATATAFAKDVVAFISGRAPWPFFETDKDQSIKVYGPGFGEVMETTSDRAEICSLGAPRTGRRSTIFGLTKFPGLTLDRLHNVWSNFIKS